MTPNLDFIMAFETGEASPDDIVREFQSMIDNGTVWQLQGMYGRYAMSLIEAGHCTAATDT